jgi:hypothetical protein
MRKDGSKLEVEMKRATEGNPLGFPINLKSFTCDHFIKAESQVHERQPGENRARWLNVSSFGANSAVVYPGLRRGRIITEGRGKDEKIFTI